MTRLSFGLESSSSSPDITVRMGEDVTAESSDPSTLHSYPNFGRVYTFDYAIHGIGLTMSTGINSQSQLQPPSIGAGLGPK
jgi:hypothetical protein